MEKQDDRPLGRSVRRWENNIQIDLKNIGRGGGKVHLSGGGQRQMECA